MSSYRQPAIQRLCSECEEDLQRQPERVEEDDKEEKQRLQMKSRVGPSIETSPDLQARITNLQQGGGQPLPLSERAFLEPRFGRDFSRVKIHTDVRAAEMARSVNARAFTVGRDVVFGAGQYQPSTSEGQRLLAHELTHVVQQQRTNLKTVQRKHVCENDPRTAPSGMSCAIASSSPSGSGIDMTFNIEGRTLSGSDIASLQHLVRNWHAAGGNDIVRVDGFASCDGSASFNWRLSCDRAFAVAHELIHPSDPTLTGISPAFVEIFANGETDKFSTRLAPNRRVTLNLSATPPKDPSAIPSKDTPSGPICGPDVTTQVIDAVNRTRTTFAGWDSADREKHCNALDSYRTGAYAWDIIQLHNHGWIHEEYRPACATKGATPPCGSTVQINTGCSYAGSPNYVIYGVMCRLCHDHYAAVGSRSGTNRFTHARMQSWINFYKGTRLTGLRTPARNFIPSTQWATAGYQGWPSASTPAGDRPNCGPRCTKPYPGIPFRVAWWSLTSKRRLSRRASSSTVI